MNNFPKFFQDVTIEPALLHGDMCGDNVAENDEGPGTVKFLHFLTTENFAVNNLKFKQRGQSLGYFIKEITSGIANSEDPDQTAPVGAV